MSHGIRDGSDVETRLSVGRVCTFPVFETASFSGRIACTIGYFAIFVNVNTKLKKRNIVDSDDLHQSKFITIVTHYDDQRTYLFV